MRSHAAVAAEFLGEAKVIAVLEDGDPNPADRALFAFVRKLNLSMWDIGPADIAALEAAGWTQEAIYDAINVCSLFNFYNRWIDGSGVHAMSEEEHRASGKRMKDRGYLPHK